MLGMSEAPDSGYSINGLDLKSNAESGPNRSNAMSLRVLEMVRAVAIALSPRVRDCERDEKHKEIKDIQVTAQP
jgi:hypothetical protein